ncbi:MAG TPA: tripartite tricarboxylate transporter substrate binding protein [Clostridia bacterium]|nr:tripartite tricarboxylate transporter substrate binding protein [Clostridia bacterium]
MNKKVLALALALMFTLSLTAGCASGTASNGDGTVNTAEDDYPNDPVKILVGYSAGGSSDKLARLLQPYLKEALGTSVVVENMPGASGQVAATTLFRGAPDGYTILAVNSPGIYYTIAMQDAKYAAEDLYPLWVESRDPIVFLALKDSPWNSLKDFIEACKAEPGKYAVGVASGGGQQSVALWLKKNLDLNFNLVTFDGGGPTSAALLGSQVDAIFGDAYARADLVDEAKCLGVASVQVNSVWPDGVPFKDQLAEYNIALPEDEFQSRYGAYWVKKEFAEKYPERYEKLLSAFEVVAKNEKYINTLKEAGLYDSMVLKDGKEYEDDFAKSFEVVKTDIAPLFTNQKK